MLQVILFSLHIPQRRFSGIRRICLKYIIRLQDPSIKQLYCLQTDWCHHTGSSQGYGLHCFDMRTGTWDEVMCEKLGIPVDFLPEIVALR